MSLLPELRTTLHVLPSQCSMNGPPAAHTSLGPEPATASNSPESGVKAIVQLVPSQCSTTPLVGPTPTAQASSLARMATPNRSIPSGFGVGTSAHETPFQCSAIALGTPPVKMTPTAQASWVPSIATAL